jgi:hypothetical protein
MIATLLRSNRLLTVYALGLLLVASLLVESYFQEGRPRFTEGSQYLMDWLLRLPDAWLLIFNGSMILGGAILFNQLINDQKISKAQNGLFFQAYLIGSLAYFPWIGIQAAIYSTFFLLLIIRFMMIAGNSKRQLSLVFNAGLMGGLAYLMYQPAWVFLPVSLITILLSGIFRFRSFVLWLLGAITPAYLLVAFHYLVEGQINIPQLLNIGRIPAFPLHALEPAQHWLAAFGLTSLILGILVSFTGGNLKTNALRNAQRLFFILLICGLLAVVLVPGDGWMNAALFVPVGAFYVGRLLEAIELRWQFNAFWVLWVALIFWNAWVV